MKHLKLCAWAISVAALCAPAQGFFQQQIKNGMHQVNPISEDRIKREVRHELVMLPYYGVFDNLAYRVDGATVTLLGQVTWPTLKSDAGNVV